MRNRLIELLDEYGDDISFCDICDRPSEDCEACKNEQLADHLIANGVIVPPCNVGDTIWYELYGQIDTAVIYSCIGSLRRNGFIITDANAKNGDGIEVAFNGNCIGKTVFLSREEAERALHPENDIDLLTT